MSTVEIVVPSVGESIVEGTLGRWLVADGAFVERGAPLFELETDKTNTEVPSPAAGVLRRAAAEGGNVKVGAVVGTIDTAARGAAAPAPAPAAPKPTAPAPAPAAAAAPASALAVVAVRHTAPKEGPAPTPVAQALMREHGIDASQVAFSGTRIRSEDVLAVIRGNTTPKAPDTPKAASTGGDRPTRRVPMSPLRKMMARRLVEAKDTVAMLSTFNEVDMSAVIALRKAFGEAYQKRYGVPMTLLSFFVRASVEACREVPRANAAIEGDEIVSPNYVDVAFSVATKFGQAMPVLRSADRLSFPQIEAGIAGLSKKAQEGSLGLGELVGATFSISSDGDHGALLGTPMLNPPATCALGLHRIVDRPVAVAGKVEIRPMMYLALSYDHRLLDGRDAVLFLVRIKDCIERPERMLLEI
jgi:2-oxoglutarate dehydrogenase E2 component (dihydrolipoamide succinyltransferase)